jgi:hypothetical protein
MTYESLYLCRPPHICRLVRPGLMRPFGGAVFPGRMGAVFLVPPPTALYAEPIQSND